MFKRGEVVRCPAGRQYIVGGVDPIQGGLHLIGQPSRDGKPWPSRMFTTTGKVLPEYNIREWIDHEEMLSRTVRNIVSGTSQKKLREIFQEIAKNLESKGGRHG